MTLHPKTEAKHTPTPWKVKHGIIVESGNEKESAIAYCRDEYRHSKHLRDGDEADANAAFICLAVNNFKALKGTVQYLEGYLNRFDKNSLPKEFVHAHEQSQLLIKNTLTRIREQEAVK